MDRTEVGRGSDFGPEGEERDEEEKDWCDVHRLAHSAEQVERQHEMVGTGQRLRVHRVCCRRILQANDKDTHEGRKRISLDEDDEE